MSTKNVFAPLVEDEFVPVQDFANITETFCYNDTTTLDWTIKNENATSDIIFEVQTSGMFTFNNQISLTYDIFASGNAQYVNINPSSITSSAVFVGGGVAVSPTLTFTNTIFIWNCFAAAGVYTSGVAPNPVFAAFTLMNAAPQLKSDNSLFRPLSVSVIVASPQILVDGAGAGLSAAAINGISVGARLNPVQAGDTASASIVGLAMSPQYNAGTSSSTTVNFNNVIAVNDAGPSLIFFGTNPGSRIGDNRYGLNFNNNNLITWSGVQAVINTNQAAASNKYVIRATGTAQSLHTGPFTIGDFALVQNKIDVGKMLVMNM